MTTTGIKKWFTKWCDKTKRNGGVLIGKSIAELLFDFDAHPKRCTYSEKYLAWVKSEMSKPKEKQLFPNGLTSSQHVFAEWLLKNSDTVSAIGNLEDVFISVRNFIKRN